MESYPTNTLENGQDAAVNAQANAWTNMTPGAEAATEVKAAETPGETVVEAAQVASPAEVAAPASAETLAAPAAAELGGAALDAMASAEVPGVASTEVLGTAPTATAGAASAEMPGAGQEAEKSLETGKVSDKEMVGYIIGRLTQDLELPDLKAVTPEATKKRAEVNASIKIFDQVSFMMNDNEQKNKEPVPVETILTVIAGENRYSADKSQDEAEKAERTQVANLADEWAGSYAKRKERLESERAEAAKPGAEQAVATENNSGAQNVTESNPLVSQEVMDAASGVQNTVTEGANLTPANAGETTQNLTVPLPTEGIV